MGVDQIIFAARGQAPYQSETKLGTIRLLV